MKISAILMAFLAIFMLAGCTAGSSSSKGRMLDVPAKASMTELASLSDLDPVLACVRPYVQGKVVALTGWADSTGKENAVSDGGTGRFMAGTASADFTIGVFEKAGMHVQDLASVSGEGNLRELVTPEMKVYLAKLTTKTMPDYYINGSWLSLDFTKSSNLSLIIKGIGGFHNTQSATLSGGVKLVEPGTLLVRGNGRMKLTVRSTQAGVMLGRVFGNTLATGEGGVGDQQPMQLWGGEYIATISAAKALVSLPYVPETCASKLSDVVGPDIVAMM